MSTNLDWKLTASRNDLLRELEKTNQKMAQQAALIQDAQRKADEAARKNSRNQKGAQKLLTDQAKNLVAMGASWLTVTQAASAYTQELRRQAEINERAAEAQKGVSAAQQDFKLNLGAVSPASAEAYIARVIQATVAARIPSMDTGFATVGSLLSATGGNQDLSLSIFRETAPYMAETPDKLPAFAGAVADMAKQAKATSDEEIRQLTTLGFSGLQQMRLTDPAKLREAVKTAAVFAAVDSSGDAIGAQEEAFEFFSALGTNSADATGETTKTALATMAARLEQYAPENTTYDTEGKVLRQGTGLKTTRERFEYVAADEQRQREFFQGAKGFTAATFEASIQPLMESLFTDTNSPIRQGLEDATAKINTDASTREMILANVEGTGVAPERSLAREGEANIAAYQMEQSNDALEATIDDIFTQTLDTANVDFFERQRASLLYFERYRVMGMDRADAAIYALDDQMYDTEGNRKTGPGADLIMKQIEVLERIDRRMEENNRRAADQRSAATSQLGSQQEPK